MKINFFLPGVYRGIAGGYKVVYQYSNYLASKGHDIHIYYSLKDGKNSKHIPKIIARLIRRIQFIGYPKWYKLNENISQSAVKNFDEKYIRDADISVATSAYTSNPVYKLSASKGKKFYLIQDYENWGTTTDEFLRESYNYGMNNIVISKWLKDIVDENSQKESVLIPNGIDLNIFKELNPIEKRNPYSISMLFSNGKRKGSEYGIKVLKKLKNKYPELKVTFFSSDNKPKNIPKWIEYVHNATEEQVVKILNNSAIYMCTSLVEGFGLPGLEAMACGCALVTTNCLGIMEYANSDNSMISKPKDVQGMYENVDKLLSDDEFRIKIAKNGNVSIQNRNLKISEEKFERFLLKNIN